MSFALIGIVITAACWKWGDWRHWQRYYPTVLYMMVGDLVADFILNETPLFAFGPFVEKYPVLDVAVMVLLYPGTVLLFLSHLPERPVRLMLYVLMWIGIYVAAEVVASLTGGFCYHNGWTIWHSVLFDCAMFPLLVLHYKKPLIVWPISAVLAFLVLWWFRVPLATS